MDLAHDMPATHLIALPARSGRTAALTFSEPPRPFPRRRHENFARCGSARRIGSNATDNCGWFGGRRRPARRDAGTARLGLERFAADRPGMARSATCLPISSFGYRWLRQAGPKATAGGNRSTRSPMPGCRPCTAAPSTPCSPRGPNLPLEPFFSGAGIDRADALRNKPEAVAALLASPEARALVWTDGIPALDSAGGLMWREANGDEPLFLGLHNGAPRFSAIPDFPAGHEARAVLGQLGAQDAPLFAVALSLSSWHLRHGFCSVCGSPSVIFRGGWARRCPTCQGEHYPRVDPVVIMLATFENRLLLGRQRNIVGPLFGAGGVRRAGRDDRSPRSRVSCMKKPGLK